MNELDQLEQAAAAIDSESQPKTPEQIEQEKAAIPPLSPAQQWAAVPKMFGSILAMALPEIATAYSDENCQNWGIAMAAVSDKYGWKAPTENAPELMLIVATLPLAVPTYQAIAANRRKAAEAARAAKELQNAAAEAALAGQP